MTVPFGTTHTPDPFLKLAPVPQRKQDPPQCVPHIRGTTRGAADVFLGIRPTDPRIVSVRMPSSKGETKTPGSHRVPFSRPRGIAQR